jgi:hypothetical protein
MWISSFPAALVEEAVFSPPCVLSSFVKDQLAIEAWVYVWIHWSFCLSLCQYHAVFIVMALYYSLKSGIVMTPAPDILLRITLAIRGLLCVYMYFTIAFSISVQNIIGILVGIALNM